MEEQKVRQSTSIESKIRPISPAQPLTASYRNRSISPSSASAMMADESNEDLWSYEISAGGVSSVLERLRSKLQQREGEMMVMKVRYDFNWLFGYCFWFFVLGRIETRSK